MFALARKLRKAGVMGLNQRNAQFTLAYNDRKLYPLVDDKLLTKQLAGKAGLAVPELYAVIEIERQVRDLAAVLEPHSDFVIKPAQGSGGDGIVVISGRSKGMYRKVNGTVLSLAELQYHLLNILSGMFSLGGQSDKVLIEYRVKFDPVFSQLAYQGVPDIRIIVFLGVPVMAMVRLPTRMSDGKANLHQGAIGAGVDMAIGTTLCAVWRNTIITEHPDTGLAVSGVQVPHWDTLLEIAGHCYELTGLGYQGVDVVLDEKLGPLILEVNARPGLNIQLANQAGLLPRLQRVQAQAAGLVDLGERIEFARQHFGVA
jgi:alpha-L-glutamate ligase-like protein